jgi:hypothetical protein
MVCQHHHVYLILYHGMFHLVTTCVCCLNVVSLVRKISTDRGSNNNLLYNERNDQLLLRQKGGLCCINLDGHVIYRCNISGALEGGLAVDQQGHVYICETQYYNYCFICTWYYSNTPRYTGKRYFIFIGFVILVYIYLIMKIITK